MPEQPSIAVHADGNWVSVPVHDETPEQYGPAVVAELGDSVPAEAREPLAHDLAMFAGRARESGAIFAAVMLAEGLDSVLAYTECLPFDPAVAGLPADADGLAAELGSATVQPPGWQVVTRADLPAGPAVRVHLLAAGRDASESADDQPVVESVSHVVPGTAAGPGVVLMTSWPALLAADVMVAEADRLASTLRVTS